MNEILERVKEADQDFEWYPTTDEIIQRLYRDMKLQSKIWGKFDIMDIGAGDGQLFRVLEQLDAHVDREDNMKFHLTKYAIEKSPILIEQMAPDIYILGTDFLEQTLIDKKMDIIFCNPPFSQYSYWMNKIIREGNSPLLYFVVPVRWIESESTKRILEQRKAKFEILGEYTFEKSAYRQARAVVNLVKVKLGGGIHYSGNHVTIDPFDLWFDENFEINADKETPYNYAKQNSKKENLHELTKGKNIVEVLGELYQLDKQKLLNTYKAVEQLDPSIMKELEINISGIKESLKQKISSLKFLYWKELFDNMDKITNRLTVKSRESMLKKLTEHTSIDFTVSNAYSVIIWAVKNANKYFDTQLLEVYRNLSRSENVTLYKSNHRILKDGWRYSHYYREEGPDNYQLDYRIVHNHWSAIEKESYDHPKGLCQSAHDTINDIFIVARNLGFNIIDSTLESMWQAGKNQTFSYTTNEIGYAPVYHVFANIKAHYNGNLHFKFNQKFMRKFNVEAGRLNGWLKSPIDAVNEMDIPIEEATTYFKSNLMLIKKNIKLLPEASYSSSPETQSGLGI